MCLPRCSSLLEQLLPSAKSDAISVHKVSTSATWLVTAQVCVGVCECVRVCSWVHVASEISFTLVKGKLSGTNVERE